MSRPDWSSIKRGVKPVDLRDVYQDAIDAGCTVSMTRGNHVRLVLPNGNTHFGPLTSGDRWSAKNARSQLRKKGLPL